MTGLDLRRLGVQFGGPGVGLGLLAMKARVIRIRFPLRSTLGLSLMPTSAELTLAGAHSALTGAGAGFGVLHRGYTLLGIGAVPGRSSGAEECHHLTQCSCSP